MGFALSKIKLEKTGESGWVVNNLSSLFIGDSRNFRGFERRDRKYFCTTVTCHGAVATNICYSDPIDYESEQLPGYGAVVPLSKGTGYCTEACKVSSLVPRVDPVDLDTSHVT